MGEVSGGEWRVEDEVPLIQCVRTSGGVSRGFYAGVSRGNCGQNLFHILFFHHSSTTTIDMPSELEEVR